MQPGAELAAEEAEQLTGVDRREFLFMSLMAAAATTFSGRAVQAQRGLQAFGTAGTIGGAAQQPTVAPFPLGNAEPPAEQFMPYPGGTGALMEKLVTEHGAHAFLRSHFWDSQRFVDPATMPTGGQVHRAIQGEQFDAEQYDSERAERYRRKVGFY